MTASPSGINSLVGEPLSGVAFVQDYVEFHFDGKVIRSLTNPSITNEGASFKFPNSGSRDALCSLIGRIVLMVDVENDRHIELTFSDGVVLRVPLEDTERVGPEAAHFVPGENQPIDVW